MSNDPRRQALWQKIKSAQSRNADRFAEHAANARDNVIRIAKEHPLRVIGGAVALGALFAVILPKRNRRKLGKTGSAFVTMATKLGMDYALRAQKTAKKASHAGQKSLASFGETLMDSTESFRQDVDRIASETSDTARGIGSRLAEHGTHAVKKVKAQFGR
jgi:hypothetical protein